MARQVLTFIPHRPVRTWERPIRQAASAEVLTGVDLALPSAAGSSRRGAGTIATQALITAGRILQASTRTEVAGSGGGRRMQWSYYLARPAKVEVIGRMATDDIVEGFLAGKSGGFDLGDVCSTYLGRVQRSAGLDRRVPMTARRVRFRWAATSTAAGEQGQARLRVDDDLRTLQLRVPAAVLPAVPELCRDLALHDWLVTVATDVVDRAGVGRRERLDVVERLNPLIDHLLHLWMPAARLDDRLVPYWEELDRRSGLGRQWQAIVYQVRDQIALAGLVRGRTVDVTDRSARRAGRETP